MQTIYPPVGDAFALARRGGAGGGTRSRSASTTAHLLLNVKRLHPLAGQRYLIEAMNEVDPRRIPDTRLVICGTGRAARRAASASRDRRASSVT